MSYKITWKPKGVVWAFYDELTSDDVIRANIDIYGDPRFDGLRYQIVDLSDVEIFSASDEAMEETAAMDQAAATTNPRLVVAVVAPGEQAAEVAKMYQAAMETSEWTVSIFNSMEEAAAWIDVTGSGGQVPTPETSISASPH